MNQNPTTHLLAAAVMATSFAIACSGPSSSMNPTSPSAMSGASAGANFSPNPGCGETPEEDDCDPIETASGRFTGGGFQIDDVRVTRGFTIHCDNLLTNNLEVNWPDGNNFHLDKNSLGSIVCTRPDDPTPPASPVSRISATGTGTCNGSAATISFILEDHGEPGSADMAQLIISGAGTCNLNLPLALLDGGNIQAHFDQPHK